jgi:hypothetical protein
MVIRGSNQNYGIYGAETVISQIVSMEEIGDEKEFIEV